jgi:hypothetical protein
MRLARVGCLSPSLSRLLTDEAEAKVRAMLDWLPEDESQEEAA